MSATCSAHLNFTLIRPKRDFDICWEISRQMGLIDPKSIYAVGGVRNQDRVKITHHWAPIIENYLLYVMIRLYFYT